MRVAVISDVHGNEHALTAVLAAIDEEAPEEIWCLGDTVGYGPSPNRCCEVVFARADVVLVGNHDLVAIGELGVEDFNHDASAAALWTRETLEPRWHDWLRSLEPSARRERVGLFHASARDPVWEYVLTSEAAWASFATTDEPLLLVGHSHVALAIDGDLNGAVAPEGREVELDGNRWLLNPGSVGQPRDGDPRAAWLLLDLERRFASFRRVAYSIERTQAEIRAAGLPGTLAERLSDGI